MARASKRDAIVEAAMGVLAAQGPEALTAANVARRAGVSKANLFHHFANLDEVVLAAFEAFLMEMPSMWPENGTTLRAWLLALGADTSAQVGADPALSDAYLAFAARARSTPALRQRLAQIVAGAEAHFDTVLALLAPHIGAERRQALAGLILLAGDGLAVHRQLFPERAGEQALAWRAFVDSIAPEETQK